MSSAEDKARSIERVLQEEQEKLRKRFNVTLVVYGILILFLLIYTNFIYSRIYGYIGPEGLKDHGETVVNLVSQYPDELLKMYEESKNDLADSVVQQTFDAIPEAKGLLKNQIDVYNDKLGAELRSTIIPGFREYIRGTLPQLKADYKEAKAKKPDLTVGMFITDLYVEYLDKEISKILNEDAVIAQAESLQKALYTMDKAKGPITRKQEAERQIIINFIMMAKLDSEGSPILEDLHKFLEERFGVDKRQVQEDKVLDDVETNDPQEEL